MNVQEWQKNFRHEPKIWWVYRASNRWIDVKDRRTQRVSSRWRGLLPFQLGVFIFIKICFELHPSRLVASSYDHALK